MEFHCCRSGLCDPNDITVKGLEVVKAAARVYLEAYTSILIGCGKEELEKFYGREVVLADRDMIELNSDEILEGAGSSDVALLVVGDPLGATTHSDLLVRAVELEIPYRVVHNASIMNAVGCCGLQLYHFGETVSIPFWTETWKPDSFVDKIECNLRSGLHTLCLLDIKVKEQTIENLMKGRKIYEPPRFMAVEQAVQQLREAIEARTGGSHDNQTQCLTVESRCIGLARVGSVSQCIAQGTLATLDQWEMGKPLHSLVIIGNLHPMEDKMVQYACNAQLKTAVS